MKGTANKKGVTSFTYHQISPFLINKLHISKSTNVNQLKFTFINHISTFLCSTSLIACKLPAPSIITQLPKSILLNIAKQHDISLSSRNSVETVRSAFLNHNCLKCKENILTFQSVTDPTLKTIVIEENDNNLKSIVISEFPPKAPSRVLIENIITGWCNDTKTQQISEEGCTVCGKLTLSKDLKSYSKCDFDKSLLNPLTHRISNIIRVERHSESDPISEIKGEIRDMKCTGICSNC